MSGRFEVKKILSVQLYTNSKFNWNKKFVAINAYLAEHASLKCEFEVKTFDTSKVKITGEHVDKSWFDTAVTANSTADVVCLHIDRKTWKTLGGKKENNGRYFVDNDGVSEFYVVADERQTKNRGRRWDMFVHTFMHELCHALYSRGGQPLKSIVLDEQFIAGTDNTHYFDKVQKNLDLVWPDIAFLKDTKNIIARVVDSLKSAFNKPTISQFAEAIKEFEGWFPPGTKGYPKGSVSYRNNNPGNLRWSPFESGNVNNFSVFKTYDDGWKGLLHQIRIAVNGKSKVYRPTDTILQFFEKYAPSSDNNYPHIYAQFVAKKLGVTTALRLENLLDQ